MVRWSRILAVFHDPIDYSATVLQQYIVGAIPGKVSGGNDFQPAAHGRQDIAALIDAVVRNLATPRCRSQQNIIRSVAHEIARGDYRVGVDHHRRVVGRPRRLCPRYQLGQRSSTDARFAVRDDSFCSPRQRLAPARQPISRLSSAMTIRRGSGEAKPWARRWLHQPTEPHARPENLASVAGLVEVRGCGKRTK